MKHNKNSHSVTPSGTTAQPEQTVPHNNPTKCLSDKEWRETFRPIKNPFGSPYFQGALFDTRGTEFEIVRLFPADHIWSVANEIDLYSTITPRLYDRTTSHVLVFRSPSPLGRRDPVLDIPPPLARCSPRRTVARNGGSPDAKAGFLFLAASPVHAFGWTNHPHPCHSAPALTRDLASCAASAHRFAPSAERTHRHIAHRGQSPAM